MYSYSDTGGTFTTFNNGTVEGQGVSTAFGINDQGEIVGGYEQPTFVGNAYVGTPGNLTTLTPPFGVGGGTSATGINDAGLIVGTVKTLSGYEGFSDNNGTFTPINYPGKTVTSIQCVNNEGQFAGAYGPGGSQVGIFTDTSGIFQSLNAPGSIVYGINDYGQMVGSIGNSGFLYTGGKTTIFNIPGQQFTQAHGINNQGQIVGVYTNINGPNVGFLTSLGTAKK